jgi:hypothetical protein
MTYHRTEVAIEKLSQEKNLLLDIVKIALDTYKELLQEKVQKNKQTKNPLLLLLWTMSKSKQICSRDKFLKLLAAVSQISSRFL